MAAKDAKTSPSSKDVHTTTVAESDPTKVAVNGPVNLKSNPSSSSATDANPAATQPAMGPSYESSEASENYVLAKSLLASGDFEQALQLIEQGIQEAQAVLLSLDVEDADLHECMAPFHYLYGTTLLYSIEESNDTQMTVPTQTTSTEAAFPSSEGSSEVPSQPHQNNALSDEHVEDMEISWENLDTARNIVERLLTEETVLADEKRAFRLRLDLSQILLREGDLQRMNGRYSEAIQDYEACLELRQSLLPMFDRKIADAQYNLGLSHLSFSSELQKTEEMGPGDNVEAHAGGANPAAKQTLAREHCQKGVDLYLECARTLCGQIAGLCAVDPSVILSSSEDSMKPLKAGLKTTGMEDAAVLASRASNTLHSWRNAVTFLTPVESNDPRLEDLKELLDEIQETIDEAERSREAVREASQLKIQAQNAVSNAEDGSTTQIGFAPFPSSITKTPGSIPASSVNLKPTMVIKKKQKREADSQGSRQIHQKHQKTQM